LNYYYHRRRRNHRHRRFTKITVYNELTVVFILKTNLKIELLKEQSEIHTSSRKIPSLQADLSDVVCMALIIMKQTIRHIKL
jgi:hypothetical protein